MGDGCLYEILNELYNSGYEGFLSLEPHLGQFEGLAELEKEVKIQKTEETGEVLFEIAYNALEKIMERIENNGR